MTLSGSVYALYLLIIFVSRHRDKRVKHQKHKHYYKAGKPKEKCRQQKAGDKRLATKRQAKEDPKKETKEKIKNTKWRTNQKHKGHATLGTRHRYEDETNKRWRKNPDLITASRKEGKRQRQEVESKTRHTRRGCQHKTGSVSVCGWHVGQNQNKKTKVEAVTEHVNAVHNNNKVTQENVSGDILTFLDCAVHIGENRSLNTEVYTKHTD